MPWVGDDRKDTSPHPRQQHQYQQPRPAAAVAGGEPAGGAALRPAECRRHHADHPRSGVPADRHGAQCGAGAGPYSMVAQPQLPRADAMAASETAAAVRAFHP